MKMYITPPTPRPHRCVSSTLTLISPSKQVISLSDIFISPLEDMYVLGLFSYFKSLI